MIVLRNEQLDVLRASARKKLGQRIKRSLVAKGLTVAQQGSDLLLHDSRKQATRLTFAPDGSPNSIVRPSGLSYRFEFDKAGRLAGIVYPSGRQLAFSCDTVGNVTQLSQPGYAQYQLSYTEPAQQGAPLESLVYPDGRVRQFVYDDDNKVIAIVEPSGASYEFERDEHGHIAAMLDPLQREITLVADDAGALQGIVFPDGSEEAFVFDAAEQTAVRVHRDGSQTHYKLDGQQRIAQIVSGDQGASSFGYDDQGRLSFVEQGGQRISFKSEANQTQQEHGPDGKVDFEHDGDGRLIGLKNPFGDRLQYAYNPDGRLASILLWDGRSIQIESNDEDLIASLQFPGGVVVQQHYGPALRLSRRQVHTAAGLVDQVSYSYDDCARLTGYAQATPQGRQCQISYDEDDHVVQEVFNGQSQPYTFDIKGNMLQAGETAVVVGPMDEPLRQGGQAISYDPRGNMLQLPGVDGPLACQYRHDGTLTECRAASGTVTFKYDALGRRIEKRSHNQIWRFGWAGHQLLWEEHKAAEYATPVRRDYLFLPGTMLPLGFREQSRCYWLMTDARGAVDLALDDHGQVVWKAHYDSFGQVELEVNKVRQPWRMQGQYADDETGLYYNFARYYSPYLRSYLSLDPRWIEFDASHYSYCRNDPWNRVDPFGGKASPLASGTAGLVAELNDAVTAAVTGGDPRAGAIESAVASFAAVVGASADAGAGAGAGADFVDALAGALSEQAKGGDPICVECPLQASGVAGTTDLALLGLNKIPGTKQLTKALGNKWSKFTNSLKRFAQGKLNQLKSRMQQLREKPVGSALVGLNWHNAAKSIFPGQQTYQNCGLQSSRQVIEQAKGQCLNKTELDFLDDAIKTCGADKAANHPVDSGGTNAAVRKCVLKQYGVESSVKDATVANVADALKSGKGIIISADVSVLWQGRVSHPGAGRHAVVITHGVYDREGNLIGVSVNDTGINKRYTLTKQELQDVLDSGSGSLNVTDNRIWPND